MKRNQIKSIILASISGAMIMSCTDLELDETDSIIDESTATGGTFNGVPDPASALNNTYSKLNNIGDQTNLYALMEVSGDIELVPTRGTDWGDNGLWRNLHNHTWGSSHEHVLNTWNVYNEAAFLASEIIDSRSNASTEQIAGASFIKAFATWIIMDLYGQVPVRAVDSGPADFPSVITRSEALAIVLADLDTAIAGLPSVASGEIDSQQFGSKASARFLKARVLLNAHIYNGSGTPSSADMTEVVSLVDAIAAEGYALESGYFNIFEQTADSETIWWLPTGVGNRIWNGMHYNINSPDNGGGGWNGFSVLSEFYDSFEGNATSNYIGDGQEERRGWVPDATTADEETNFGIGYGMLIGQQYDGDGTPLKTRPGAPLIFTKEFNDLFGNGEAEGIRSIKYHPAGEGGSFRAHNIIFRYADAHLMKAEAIMRNGGDPTSLVNELRTLRGATPIASVTEADLLAERGRELYKEVIRRTDLIRFGQFTRNWEFKDEGSVGDETKALYPIPQIALLSNPNLVQNPGY